ncbi:TonB-dependent receptor plug domain-containing protein [Helicobacter sp. 13S00477-4]|uniref:TonB-dependent receptor family protein n=1 Tax=Helicobacter sp. 13S00477-4 TaxID=1905759 RepID=UPI000BA54779|nr:TonB-dependent receptor plug domain-containing protein [Helicobacter sp. 13S00477-4]PAF51576.1 hypothetical protein BKH44_04990 [Helicobacter sp. 13S00477-4]
MKIREFYVFNLLLLSPLIGNEILDLEKTKPIIITGNLLKDSRAEDIRDFTGSRSIVSHQVLHQTGYNALDQAFQSIPGVQIRQDTAIGALPEIHIRGMPSGRAQETQVFLDGVPLSPAPYSNLALSAFPVTFSMIDRIDVVRGGAAIQYGPTNVGGVINFISKSIPNIYESEASLKTTSYLYNNFLFDTYLRTGGMVNKIFGFQAEGNFVKGNGYRENSQTQLQDYSLKGVIKLQDDSYIKMGYSYYNADVSLPGALIPQLYLENPYMSVRSDDKAKSQSHRVFANYNQKFEKFLFAQAGEFNLLTYYNYLHRDLQLLRTTNSQFQDSPRNYDVFGVNPRLTFYSIASDWFANTLVLGGQYTLEIMDFKARRYGIAENRPVFSDIKSNTKQRYITNAFAAYVSNEMTFFDFFSITPAIRYENINENYIYQGRTVKVDAWLPSMSVGITPIEEIFIYWNSQRSIRPPQVGHNFDTLGEIFSTEKAWNHEIGIRYMPNRLSMISLGYFNIDYKGKTLYDRKNNKFTNQQDVFSQGIELEAYYSPLFLSNLTLHGSYSYTDSRYKGKNNNNRIENISPHHFTFDAFYKQNNSYAGISLFWYSKAFSDKDNIVLEDLVGKAGIVPAYFSMNFSLGYDFRFKDQIIKTTLGINNLLDNKYYYRSSSQVGATGREPAPSRSVFLKISYIL